MSVPILYLTSVPDLANGALGGDTVPLIADDATAQHFAVLATVGGLLALGAITSGGYGVTTGTYLNVPIITSSGKGNAGTVNITAIGGTASVIVVNIPGFNYPIGAFTVSSAAIGGTGNFTTFSNTSVLPCSPPFPLNTRFVEICCDANGPAFITLDSTLTTVGLTNGLLTTQQATLTTTSARIATNERILRRVPGNYSPIPGSYGANFALPLQYQVIMGTAAA